MRGGKERKANTGSSEIRAKAINRNGGRNWIGPMNTRTTRLDTPLHFLHSHSTGTCSPLLSPRSPLSLSHPLLLFLLLHLSSPFLLCVFLFFLFLFPIVCVRFRGKRVVYLKQLASGLLLVTGPYKVNGVPLRRINQAYVIATSTRLDVSKIDVSKIDDAFFAKNRKAASKAPKKDFLSKDEKKVELPAIRKTEQARIDSALKPIIAAVPHLNHYLNAKFTLTNGQRPHLLKF